MTPGQAIAALARRQPRPFSVLMAVVATFTAVSLRRGDGRVWAFLVVVAVGLAAFALADRSARFGDRLVWALTAFAGAHLCGGLLPSPSGAPTFYETWLVPGVLKYDQLVHLAGSALATAVAWHLLGRHLDHDRTSAATQAQLAAAVGLGKGALNEVFEFLASLSGQDVIIGDGTNTGWDLVFNVAGVAIAAVWLAASGAARSTASADDVEDATTTAPGPVADAAAAAPHR